MYTMGSRHTNSGGHFELRAGWQGDLKPGSNFIKYLLSTRLLDHENSKGRDENTSTPLKIAIQNKKGKWFNSYMKMTTSIPAYIGFLWDIWEEIPIGWLMHLINFMCIWRTLLGSGELCSNWHTDKWPKTVKHNEYCNSRKHKVLRESSEDELITQTWEVKKVWEIAI